MEKSALHITLVRLYWKTVGFVFPLTYEEAVYFHHEYQTQNASSKVGWSAISIDWGENSDSFSIFVSCNIFCESMWLLLPWDLLRPKPIWSEVDVIILIKGFSHIQIYTNGSKPRNNCTLCYQNSFEETKNVRPFIADLLPIKPLHAFNEFY